MTRTEHDALGPVELPDDALFGPATGRAVVNFPISGWVMPWRFLAALGHVKRAAALVHRQAGRLDDDLAEGIITAAGEVINGTWNDQFPVDVFQTGSGTSTNMNANEVIARRACQLLDRPGAVHPNDHVNMAQSSNDVIPTAMYVAAAWGIHEALAPALRLLRDALAAKADEFDGIVKIARTHLMDAVPIRLGQEFGGYAASVDASLADLQQAMTNLCELPLGGTAAGTGLNCPPGFARDICVYLYEELRLPFCEAGNHVAAASNRNLALAASGSLRRTALSLGKIASDLRLLASGPRCGLGELRLPALQPGSSIMPGKVNPVLCESVIQVACQVVGCDAAIAAGATGGVGSILELNLAMPMIAWNLQTQVDLLASSATAFAEQCIAGIEPDRDRCTQYVEQSLAMVTVLVPEIGYDRATELAHGAMNENKTIREVCLERNVLPEEKLNELLDPRKQTGN